MPNRIRIFAVLLTLSLTTPHLYAQAAEDVLSQKEIDTLRDTAFVPNQRIAAFTQFLTDRQSRIAELVAKRRSHTDYGGDMHDALDQFSQITDELNDNLDEYSRAHRDVRKALPKLLKAIDTWNATLNTVPAKDSTDIVRRLALDNLKDTHDLAQQLGPDLDAWFKAHPEALKDEQKRTSNPHAVRPD